MDVTNAISKNVEADKFGTEKLKKSYVSQPEAEAIPVKKTGGLVATPNAGKAYAFIKRAFDIVSSLLVLIILSPILLLTAIAIYIDDPGPVFYSNELIGKDLKPFRILKFRSMVQNAAEINVSAHEDKGNASVTFKLANDPRVTRVGRFIRRTSIDELPQLINIMRGDMSVVGPRPLPPYAYKQLSAYDQQRYKVKGGLLCTWQISDRSRISLEEWMDMDIQYINDANVWTDLKIVLKAIPAMVRIIFKNDQY